MWDFEPRFQLSHRLMVALAAHGTAYWFEHSSTCFMLLEIPLTLVLPFLHDIFAACYLVWKLPQDGYLAYGFFAIASEILSIIETKYKRYKWVNLLATDFPWIETNAWFFVIMYLDCDEFRRAALYKFTWTPSNFTSSEEADSLIVNQVNCTSFWGN